MESILKRRSIRRYTKEQVSPAMVKTLLEAAMSAPSAHNERPWHFIVLNDRKVLDEIPEVHPYAQMLKEAPMAILVCCDTKLLKTDGFWVQDLSAATENILLAAQELGLGSVWLGVYPKVNIIEAISKIFELPEDIIPFSIVSIGYPAEEKNSENRYNVSRVHYNKW